MAKTLQPNQIADAIITAPGTRIEISDGQPVNDISLGATYTKIMPEDEASISFVAPVAGLYDVRFRFHLSAPSTSTSAKFKLTFDGTDDVGDSDRWQVRVTSAGDYDTVVFYGEIELTAGTHTVTAYGIEVAGTGAIIPGSTGIAAGAPVLVLTLASGSGAGGILAPNKFVQSANRTITATAYSPIPTEPMSVTFTTAKDEVLSVGLHVQGISGTGANTGFVQLRLDGTLIGNEVGGVFGGTAWQLPITDSFTVQVDAGNHTLELYAKTSTSQSWSIVAGSWIDVDQFRGGQVPWERDGVQVLDTPRAINVVGGTVNVADDGSGKLEVSLPTAVTAPGAIVEIWDTTLTGAQTVSSATWTDVDGNLDESFTLPHSGEWVFRLQGQAYAVTSGVDLRWRLVFGAAGTVGGSWGQHSAHTVGTREQFGIEFPPVTIPAGTETVKLQWQRIAGTGSGGADNFGGWRLTAESVTGSSAGGEITDKVSLSSDHTGIGTSFTTITDGTNTLELTFNVVAGESVIVFLRATATSSASTGAWSRLLLGGSQVDESVRLNNANGGTNLDIVQPVTFSTAGSKTITAQAKVSSGTLTVEGDSTRGVSTLYIMRLRGGLVPVRHNGVAIIDTPQATDYVGDNVQVTNVGGVAKVEFNGLADGLSDTPAELSADFSTSSTSFVDVDNGGGDALTVDVEAIEGEKVLILLEGYAIHTGGANRIDVQYDVAGTLIPATGLIAESGNSGYSFGLGSASPVVSPALSAGSNTIKVQTKVSSNSVTWKQGAKLVVLQCHGGYVQPENLPILEYSSSSVVDIASAPGADSTLRAKLSDGVRYTASSSLSVDLSTSGLGGLDTGSEASDTWYFIYLVPSATEGVMAAVASVTDPDSGGPTGYDAWRWVGAIHNNSSSNIRQFWQVGEWFYSDPSDTDVTLLASDAATKGSWTNLTTALETAVPTDVADVIQVRGFVDGDSGQTNRVFVEPGNPPSITISESTEFASVALLNTQDNSQDASARVTNLFDGTLSYYVNQPAGSGNVNVSLKASAWSSSRLVSREARAQALHQTEVTQRSSGPVSLTKADSGKIQTNEGATAQVVFNLPTAQANLRYSFIVQDSDGIQVVAASGDTIRIAASVSAAAGNIATTTVGNTVDLVAINATEWVALSHEGTWTVT